MYGRYYPWGLALGMYTANPGKHYESYQELCRYHGGEDRWDLRRDRTTEQGSENVVLDVNA